MNTSERLPQIQLIPLSTNDFKQLRHMCTGLGPRPGVANVIWDTRRRHSPNITTWYHGELFPSKSRSFNVNFV